MVNLKQRRGTAAVLVGGNVMKRVGALAAIIAATLLVGCGPKGPAAVDAKRIESAAAGEINAAANNIAPNFRRSLLEAGAN